MTGTRLEFPRAPEPSPPPQFPLLATLAPVLGSVAIWAITSSPFALVFAALGPLIAVASVADSAVQRRRGRRRAADALTTALAELSAAVDLEHERERAAAIAALPGPAELLSAPDHDPERWRGNLSEPLPVSLGLGTVPSSLAVAGNPPGLTGAELLARAGSLDRAPVAIDARWGIGVCGPPVPAVAVARSILVQVAAALPPGRVECRGDGWVAGLPHTTGPAAGDGVTVFAERSATVTIAAAEERSLLPAECRVVLRVGSGPTVVLAHPDPASRGSTVAPVFVGAEEAADWAARLSAIAGAADGPPEAVALAELEQPPSAGRSGLPARFTHGSALDLVADGPHAVVGGTTGAGKSELLASWVLAIAAGHGPHEVSFLLVDFKGGASFSTIRALPHVVGLVTDLDETAARRAILSLRAELRLRERVLAEAGVRSIEELPEQVPLARLVVMVDEFAAVVAGFPELAELFTDVAARGRSLGVHLVLCTQRPAGVVRDSLLANCPLRVSLRVTSKADSIALVGTEAAAALSVHPRGRAVIAAGGEPEVVQVALAAEPDVVAVAERWSQAPPPRRPWQDPLPSTIPLATLPKVTRGIAFGLLDRPEEQRHEPAVYDPVRDGNLLVLGGHRSGKTTALATIASGATSAGGAEALPGDPDSAWDLLAERVTALRMGTAAPGLLLVDDVDLLLVRTPDEHRQPMLDLVLELLRAGSGAGLRAVLSARRLTGQLQSLGALCDSRVLLSLPDRQEHLVAGGESSEWDPLLPPGGGRWRSARLQVARSGHPLVPVDHEPAPVTAIKGPAAVICADPAALAGRIPGSVPLAAARPVASADAVVVGSPDDWNAEWTLLARLRATGTVVVHGLSVPELRSLGGFRGTALPLTTPGSFWLLRGGALSRGRLW